MIRVVHPSAQPATGSRYRRCAIRSGTVRFAERIVLDGIDLTVGPADRLAIIGDNGAGKSTLLGVLAGRIPLASGDRLVTLPGGFALAEQRPVFPAGTTIGGAIDLLLADLRSLETRIRDVADAVAHSDPDTQAGLLRTLGDLMDRFEARDGYRVDQRVAESVEQLGLGGLDRQRPVAELSGGERARLALATALASQAELLLFDEPTNDLDDAGLAWLEDRLAKHRGALVVVTHDRTFLDRFATDVIRVDSGGLARYGNGYSGYLVAREVERQQVRERHETWRQEVARNTALVEANAFRMDAIPRKMEMAKFGHGAFRGRSRDHGAAGRIRIAKERLARLRAEPAPRPPEPLRFTPGFGGAAESGRELPLLTVDSLRLGSPGRGPWLATDGFAIRPGERWLVTGPNGAGKTTLLRVLAGELAPDRGTVVRRPGIRIGRLRQDLGSAAHRTVTEEFAALTGMYPGDAADRLRGLGLFDASDLDRRISVLSVGQHRRFELAVAVSLPGDVLLLDEPTNHLAPDLVEQLESALRDYPGAVVTVTHDRRWRRNALAHGGVRGLRVSERGRVTVS